MDDMHDLGSLLVGELRSERNKLDKELLEKQKATPDNRHMADAIFHMTDFIAPDELFYDDERYVLDLFNRGAKSVAAMDSNYVVNAEIFVFGEDHYAVRSIEVRKPFALPVYDSTNGYLSRVNSKILQSEDTGKGIKRVYCGFDLDEDFREPAIFSEDSLVREVNYILLKLQQSIPAHQQLEEAR